MRVATAKIKAGVFLILFFTCPHVGADSSGAAEILRIVTQLIQQGDLLAAREKLVRAIKDHPAEAGFYNLLGVVEVQQGNYSSAEASFLQAIARAPQSPGAYLNLGRLYQEKSSRDPAALNKALATYLKLLRHRPDDVEANFQSALLFEHQGEFRRSVDHLLRLPASAQQRAQALAVRCADHVGLGEFSRARELAARLLDCSDLAEADVLTGLRVLEPRRGKDSDELQIILLAGLVRRGLASTDSLRRLALMHERLGQLDQAREMFERAATESSVSVELLLDLARLAYKQRDHQGALGYLAHARDLKPENAGIHFFFGMVCIELDLGGEAYQSLSKAVSLEQGNPYYNYAMGAVALHRRDPSEAIPYFRKYRELKPEDPRGRLALGMAYVESADLDSARKELEEAIAHPEAAAGAYYFLARLLRQEGKLSEAVDAVQRSLAANPDYADAHAELGLLRFRQREYELAGKALRRALELDPSNYQGNFTLLMLYRRTGDERAEAQGRRFEEVKARRLQKTQDFLRTIEIRPYN